MFLATTALVELWDRDDEIACLNHGCLLFERRAEWQGLRYSVLPDPWPSAADVAAADQRCAAVIDAVMPRLSALLNELNGVSFSERYWRLIAGPWLLWYVHAFYDRYGAVRAAFERQPALRTVVLDDASHTTPVDAADFVRLSHHAPADVYNLQIYSQAIRALDVPAAQLRRVTVPQPAPAPASAPSPARRALQRVAAPAIRAMQPAVMIGDLDLAGKEQVQLLASRIRRGCAMPAQDLARAPSSLSPERSRFAELSVPGDDRFTTALLGTFAANIPTLYLEGYADFRGRCHQSWPSPPKVCIGSTAWSFNEAFKFIAAEAVESGARHIDVQHGGGYGMCAVTPHERFSRSVADRWLTYGWTDQRDGKATPIAHARFAPARKARRARRATPPRVMLVTASVSRFRPRFETFAPFMNVLDWRARFVNALKGQARQRLVVRPHLDFGWAQQQRLAAVCGEVTVVNDAVPLIATPRDGDVLVVEYPGTAFLESFASEAPAIAFWDPSIWADRPEAALMMAELRSTGLLCDTPEQAAGRINLALDEGLDWWQSAPVRAVRSAFIDRFARGDDGWLQMWNAAIDAELDIGSAAAAATLIHVEQQRAR